MQNGVDGPILLELTSRQVQDNLGIRDAYHLHSFEVGVLDLKEKHIKYDHWDWSHKAVIEEFLVEKGLESFREGFKRRAIHGGVLFRLTPGELRSMSGSRLRRKSLQTTVARAKVVGRWPKGMCVFEFLVVYLT